MAWRASSTAKLLLLTGAAVLSGLSLFHFVTSAEHSRAYGFVDFPLFLAQAAEFLETGVLYPDPDDAARYAPAAPVYKFPPLYAILLLPVVRGGIDPSALLYHWSLQIALYAAALALLFAALGGRRLPAFLFVGMVLGLNFEPFFETLWRLQLETPILLMLTLAFFLFRRGKDPAAGGLLGICVMLKLYPAFLLLYFALKKRWKVVAWCLIAMALVQVASLIVVGPRENAVYFTTVLPAMAAENPVVNVENLSPGSYARTLLGAGPGWAKRIGQGIALILLALSVWALRRRDPRLDDTDGDALEYSLFLAVMLLALANSWVNYQLLLLFPLFALGRHVLGHAGRRGAVILLAGLAWLTMLFYAPCAGPELSWPCAQTPVFLGLFRFPRPFHDFMVELRGLAPVLIWGATMLSLLGSAALRRRGGEARES